MKLRNMLLGLMLLSVAARGTWATSLKPLGVEGMRRAEVYIFFGGGLAENDPGGLQLFGGDKSRAHRLEAALRLAMKNRLQQSGIEVEAGSKSGFSVGIFGRPVGDSGCTERYVVLINFSVTNEKYGSAPVMERGVLEVPTDHDLEQDIQRRVLLLLDEILKNSRRE
jgi:hypothetical protein